MKKYVKKKVCLLKNATVGTEGGAISRPSTNGTTQNVGLTTITRSQRQELKRKVNIGLRLNSIVQSDSKTLQNSSSKVTSKLQFFRDMVSSKLRPCVKKRKSVDEKDNCLYSSLPTASNVLSSPKQRASNNVKLTYSSSLRSAKYCKTPVKLHSKHKALHTLNQSFGGDNNKGPKLFPGGELLSSGLQQQLQLESCEQLLPFTTNQHLHSQQFFYNDDRVTNDIIKAVQTNYNLSKDFVLTSEGLKKIVFPLPSASNVNMNYNGSYNNSDQLESVQSNDGALSSNMSRPSSSQSLSNPHPYHTRQYSDSCGSYNYAQQLTLTSEDETAGSFYGSARKLAHHRYNSGEYDDQQHGFTNENYIDLSYNSESHMHSTFNHNNKSSLSSQTVPSTTIDACCNPDDTLDDIILRNHLKPSLHPISNNGVFNNFNCLLVSNYSGSLQISSKCFFNAETWEGMINSENLHAPKLFYLKKQKYLSIKTRAILFGWLAEVCDAFKMHRDTYYLALNYVDRYLSTIADVRCNQLQLLGVTALYVAAKLEEIYPPNLQRFVNITDGATTHDQVLLQELALVKTLKWQLNEMTAYSWLALFVLAFENCHLLQPHATNCRTHPKTRGHEKRLSSRGQWKIRCLEFPTTAFKEIVHITKLLEVAIIDAESLKYSNIVLAASVFFICRNYDQSILDFTGISFKQIENCVSWMNMYKGVIRCKRPSLSVMNTSQLSSNSNSSKNSSSNSFSDINTPNDESYNIQRHRDALKYFENYQIKVKSESSSINLANGIIVDKCYR